MKILETVRKVQQQGFGEVRIVIQNKAIKRIIEQEEVFMEVKK